MKDKKAEKTILCLIAELYEENKNLKEDVTYLVKDNRAFQGDVTIYKDCIKNLRNTLSVVSKHLENASKDLGTVSLDEVAALQKMIAATLEATKM